MNRKVQIIIAVISVLGGLLLTLYPWISNYSYEHEAASEIHVYEDSVANQEEEKKAAMIEAAENYNKDLARSQVMLTDPFVMTENQGEDVRYMELLDTDGSGVMCFVEIPKIDVYLPVYHGTDTEVLLKGIGHIEGSSLPVGGEGTHAVLSGHTGVDKAKLFTDLTEMEEGDLFFIHVLGEVLAYRVIRILVIDPEDTGSLVTEAGRDLVSLLTCTPYGVNTHRLVVTGERCDYTEDVVTEAENETTDEPSQWEAEYKKALLMGAASAAGIISLITLAGRMRSRRKERACAENE